MIEIKMMFRDEIPGVELMWPGQVKLGMRYAQQVQLPGVQFHTALVPVWAIQYATGSRYLLVLATGDRITTTDSGQVYVEPTTEFTPPLKTEWITNERFHDDKPDSFDALFWERSRVIQSFTHAETGDLYELRHGRGHNDGERWDAMRVIRQTEAGVRWMAPNRISNSLVIEQYAAIEEGKGW